jgi:hypothetical protein
MVSLERHSVGGIVVVVMVRKCKNVSPSTRSFSVLIPSDDSLQEAWYVLVAGNSNGLFTGLDEEHK